MVARLVARRPPTNSPVPVALASGALAIGIEAYLQLYVDNRPAAGGTVDAGQVVWTQSKWLLQSWIGNRLKTRPVMFGADPTVELRG